MTILRIRPCGRRWRSAWILPPWAWTIVCTMDRPIPVPPVLADLEHEGDRWIENIQKQTVRLGRLVNDLVALSRLDEEAPFPEKEDFSLSDAAWDKQGAHELQGIRHIQEQDGDPPLVPADEIPIFLVITFRLLPGEDMS